MNDNSYLPGLEPQKTNHEIQQENAFKWSRNELGLISSVTYQFNIDGTINWRAMVKPEHLYINKEHFEMRKQAVPSSIEGLEDKQLLILLGGIKEVAKLRGFSSIKYKTLYPKDNQDYVVAKCSIVWIPNYESRGEEVLTEEMASATTENTDAFGLKYLETIACNRAFVRCVRNFLNIHIVGADEIRKKDIGESDLDSLKESSAIPITAQGTLEKVASEKFGVYSLQEFLVKMRQEYRKFKDEGKDHVAESLNKALGETNAKEVASFAELPAKSARILLKVLNDNY